MATTYLTVKQSMKRGMMPAATPDNPMASSQKYMAYIMPFFALTGLYWPFGLVLYWVTTNLWTLGPAVGAVQALPVDAACPAPTGPTLPASDLPGAAAKAETGGGNGGRGRHAGQRMAAASGKHGRDGSPRRPDGSARERHANGSGGRCRHGAGAEMLRKLGRGRSEPEPQPEEPEVKLVRQQRQRQSRSKRSGKRCRR